MKRLHSIRLRLLLLAFGGTLAALVLAGLGFVTVFGWHVERRIAQELDVYLNQLAGNLDIGPDGALRLRQEPANPRFARTFGGLYWQIADESTGALLRSRSLWDTRLALPAEPPAPGSMQETDTEGPEGQRLILHEKRVVLVEQSVDRPARIAVAVTREDAETLKAGFARDLIPGLAILGAALLAGGWLQVGAGLKPFAAMRRGIGDIRSGRSRRLDAAVPSEIAPLVEEVNNLLDAQDEALTRARDRAADLAHGLRTPLTALSADVARLRDKGETGLAADIETIAVQMRRTIDRELARSRARNAGGPLEPVPVKGAAEAIARTLARTPDGKRIVFEIKDDGNENEADIRAAIDPDDLYDLLGNLMDNATRCAKSRVRIVIARDGSQAVVDVMDDGPGVAPDRFDELARRGRRLDESGGAGLGLAIVSDILAAYGSSAPDFSASPLGGLGVRFRLPAG